MRPASEAPQREPAQTHAALLDFGAHPDLWPMVAVWLGIGPIHLLISEWLRIGPRWLLLAVVIALLLPLAAPSFRRHHHVRQWVTLALTVTTTLGVVGSVALLVLRLPRERVAPLGLLRDAGLIWLINILTFALWY